MSNPPRKKNYFTKSTAALPVLHNKQEFTAIIEMKKQYQSLIKKELELLSEFQNEEVRDQQQWEGKIERKEAYIMPFVLSEPERVRREVKGEDELRKCFQDLRNINMGRYFKRVAVRLQWIKKQGMKRRAVKYFYQQNYQAKCFKAWSQHTKHRIAQINHKGVEYYKWKNLPQYFKAWRSYFKTTAIQNFEKSEAHYRTRVLNASMNTWKEYAKKKEEERQQKCESHYRGQMLFRFFNDWAQNVSQIVNNQREEARSFLESSLLKRCFQGWNSTSKIVRRERQETERAKQAKIKQQQSKIQEQLSIKEETLRQREEQLLTKERSILAIQSQITSTKNDIVHQRIAKQAELESLRAQEIERKKAELLEWQERMAQRQRQVRQRQAEIAEKNRKISQQSQQQLQRLQEIQTKRKQLEEIQSKARLRLKELQDREQALAERDRQIEYKRQTLQLEEEQQLERKYSEFEQQEESQMKVMLFQSKRQLVNESNNQGFIQSPIKPRQQSPLSAEYQEEEIEAIENRSFEAEQDSSQHSQIQLQQQSRKEDSQPFEQSRQPVEQSQQGEELVEQSHRAETSKLDEQYASEDHDEQPQQPLITAKSQPKIPEISQLLSDSSQINPNFLKYLLDKPKESESDSQDEYDIQSFQKKLHFKFFLKRLKRFKQTKQKEQLSSSFYAQNLREKAFRKWEEGVLFERDLRIDNNLQLIICQTEVKAIFLKRIIKSLQQNTRDEEVNTAIRDKSAVVWQKIKKNRLSKVKLALKLNHQAHKDRKQKQRQIKALLFHRLIEGMKNVFEQIDEQQHQAKVGIKRLYLTKIISNMRSEVEHTQHTKSLQRTIKNAYLQRMLSSFGRFQQSAIQKEEQETRLKYCLARYNKNLLKKVFKAIHIGSSLRYLQELKVKCFKGLKMYTQQKKMLRKCLEIEQQAQGKSYSYYPATEEEHRNFQRLIADEQ